jgi:uridine phosphorylase
MGFPNFKNKHSNDSIFSSEDYLDYQRKIGKHNKFELSKGIIFCYSRRLMEYVVKQYKVTKVDSYFGEIYLLNETNNNVGIIGNFGFGAPIVATILEELIAFGVNRFISIGMAGTLQKNLKIGDIIVCEKAIRDEGTSHHYLAPSKYAYASRELTDRIKTVLNTRRQKYSVGTSWTTDAPYRETVAEVKQYQAEGIATVEMEASALFAVAEYQRVQMGAIFTISDSVAELKWVPKFHLKKIGQSLEILCEAAIEALLG